MSVRRGVFLAGVSLGLFLGVTVLGSRPDTYEGHTDQVRNVVSSPDGKTLASIGKDRTIRLWDAASGKEGAVLETGNAEVWSVVFSPDGAILASRGKQTTIDLWDAAAGEKQAILHGHTDSVHALAFSPDGMTLASHSTDQTVRLWDVTTGKQRAVLPAPTEIDYAVAFSPDGKTLAMAGSSGTIRLWDVVEDKERAILRTHLYMADCLVFSPDGKSLAAGDVGGSIPELWDVASGTERGLEYPKGIGKGDDLMIGSVAFSPDGKTLAANIEETIGLWNVANGKCTAAFGEGHRPLDYSLTGILHSLGGRERGLVLPSFREVSFTPEGKLTALGVYGPAVKRWEVSAFPVKPGGVLWGIGSAILFLAAARGLASLSRRFPKRGTPSVSPCRSVAHLTYVAHRPSVDQGSSALLILLRDGFAIALAVLTLLILYSHPR